MGMGIGKALTMRFIILKKLETAEESQRPRGGENAWDSEGVGGHQVQVSKKLVGRRAHPGLQRGST